MAYIPAFYLPDHLLHWLERDLRALDAHDPDPEVARRLGAYLGTLRLIVRTAIPTANPTEPRI